MNKSNFTISEEGYKYKRGNETTLINSEINDITVKILKSIPNGKLEMNENEGIYLYHKIEKVLSYEDWKLLNEMSRLRNLNHVLELYTNEDKFEKEYECIWVSSKGENNGRY